MTEKTSFLSDKRKMHPNGCIFLSFVPQKKVIKLLEVCYEKGQNMIVLVAAAVFLLYVIYENLVFLLQKQIFSGD